MKTQLQLYRNENFYKIKELISDNIFSTIFRQTKWKVDNSIDEVVDRTWHEIVDTARLEHLVPMPPINRKM